MKGEGPKNRYECPLDTDNGAGTDCGNGGDVHRRAKREKLGQV